MSFYKDVTLCVDLIFVNHIQFFVTISKNIKLLTAEMIGNKKTSTVIQSLQHVTQKGFKLVLILADNAFGPLCCDIY